MDLQTRKRKGKSYQEAFIAINDDDIAAQRYIVILKRKIEGLPPTFNAVFGSEDKVKAESEVTRLNALNG